MNNLEAVKIGHGRHDLRELNVLDEQERDRGEMEIELTNCKRFAVGLDLEYCDTLPCDIHSARMWKLCGFVEIETRARVKCSDAISVSKRLPPDTTAGGNLDNSDMRC